MYLRYIVRNTVFFQKKKKRNALRMERAEYVQSAHQPHCTVFPHSSCCCHPIFFRRFVLIALPLDLRCKTTASKSDRFPPSRLSLDLRCKMAASKSDRFPPSLPLLSCLSLRFCFPLSTFGQRRSAPTTNALQWYVPRIQSLALFPSY
jgi:hypothetical protein